MAETLLIRLAADGAGFRDWALVDEQGQAKSPVQTGMPDTGIINAQHRAVVLVPGIEVALLNARVPVRNRQRVLRAIPYALEEQLASDVEKLHFAVGPVQDDQSYPVAVVDRALMDSWTGLLRDAGIHPQQMFAETLAVPFDDTGWGLLPDRGTVLVRTGRWSGFAVDEDSLPALAALMAAREELPPAARVFGGTVFDLEGMDLEFVQQHQTALEALAQGWAEMPGIDLLQGAYSRREEWGRMLRPWKATAALLLAAVLVSVLSTGLNYYRLSTRQAELSGEIEAVYRSAFPGARRVVDPRKQMEQELAKLQRSNGGTASDFLPLLAETGKVLQATQGISVRGASYRDGRLDLDLQADNLQILDSLKQALSSGGQMQAEIQSATTEADQKVNSRIRVQGVGS